MSQEEYIDVMADYVTRLQLGIDKFLTANAHVLSEFQLEICKTILDPDTDQDDLKVANTLIHQKIDILEKAGWSPVKTNSGDMVDRPVHYDRIPIEPTFFAQEYGLDWVTANPLKYVCRFPFKNGIEDLRKTMRYNAMKIRWLDGDPEWSK